MCLYSFGVCTCVCTVLACVCVSVQYWGVYVCLYSTGMCTCVCTVLGCVCVSVQYWLVYVSHVQGSSLQHPPHALNGDVITKYTWLLLVIASQSACGSVGVLIMQVCLLSPRTVCFTNSISITAKCANHVSRHCTTFKVC